MTKFDTLTNDITRAFAGDQMKRNKFERFVRRNIREINDRDQTRDTEYRDFQERLGNWLIPILGYNPHYASDTRKPIVRPIVDRMEVTESQTIQISASVKKLEDRAARQDAKDAARQEWLNKAIPMFVQKFVFSPLTYRVLLALGGGLATLLGIDLGIQILN